MKHSIVHAADGIPAIFFSSAQFFQCTLLKLGSTRASPLVDNEFLCGVEMGKNVAVFLDGTRNRLGKNGGTNVFALHEMALAAGGTQKCLYVTGVGAERVKTTVIDALRRRAMLGEEYEPINTRAAGRLFGALAGYGIGGRIKEAYAFIVDHYDQAEGDKLFLFGFSRGAFAARSLAGFIGQIGLLFRYHLSHVPEAYELYRSGASRTLLEKNYARMLGRQVRLGEGFRVYMIGVWDTVGALGLPPPFQKIAWRTDHHLTRTMPDNVTHGRHALALHELRTIFAPVPWMRSNNGQSLKQVWFAGAHADVGGGYEGSTLSTIPLMWMAFEAEKLGLSLSHVVVHVQDATAKVHHEIRGIFSFGTPTCRQLLSDLSKVSNDAALVSYSVHWSAIHRHQQLLRVREPYPFRRGIRAMLELVDTLTPAVAANTAEFTEPDSGADRSDLYGDQKEQLVKSLTNHDEWTPERIEELRIAILLVRHVHGWEELNQCIAQAVDDVSLQTRTAETSVEIPEYVMRYEKVLEALGTVAGKLSEARLIACVERVTLFASLNHRLPAHAIKVGKIKI
jgi:uncharacterized protein (DUF2235 family)